MGAQASKPTIGQKQSTKKFLSLERPKRKENLGKTKKKQEKTRKKKQGKTRKTTKN